MNTTDIRPTVRAREDGSVEAPKGLRWVGDYPIFANRTVMLGMATVVAISTLMLGMLLTAILVGKGRYEALPGVLGFAGLIGLGVMGLMLVVSLIFFGGKVRMEVVIDGEGVVQTMVSRRSALANLLAIFAGMAGGGSGGATTAGAGMIAAANRREAISFSDLQSISGNPKTGEIRLRNDWRTVMQLYAPAEHFEEAIQQIRSGLKRQALVVDRKDIPLLIKFLVVVGILAFGAFLLADFPLSMRAGLVVGIAVLSLVVILGKPMARRALGWALVLGVSSTVILRWHADSPDLERAGTSLALGMQLGALGLFALLGLLAGLGFLNYKPKNFHDER